MLIKRPAYVTEGSKKKLQRRTSGEVGKTQAAVAVGGKGAVGYDGDTALRIRIRALKSEHQYFSY